MSTSNRLLIFFLQWLTMECECQCLIVTRETTLDEEGAAGMLLGLAWRHGDSVYLSVPHRTPLEREESTSIPE